MTTTLKSGTYYVGDPCYALKQEDYDVFLEQCIAGDECLQGAFVLPGNHRICVLSTLWGDGSYPSSIDVDFPVDAGCISAIPWEAVDQDKLTAGGGIDRLGAKVEFDKAFDCSSDCRRDLRGSWRDAEAGLPSATWSSIPILAMMTMRMKADPHKNWRA